jgi:hypothetical protein
MYSQFVNYDEQMLDKAMPNRLDKQISTLIARLQSPWVCDRTDNRMMGFMYKRQRKAPHKWVLYRCILNGNNLYYFSDATSKRPRGIISVSFISQKMVTTEAHLLEIKNPEVSKTHLMVFSPNRLDLFATPTNEELDQWYAAFQRIINESLPPQEINFREGVLQELLPLLSQKSSQDVEKIILMIAELEHSGFVKGRVKKERTGNLEMWLDDEEEWVRYYFVLQNKCLYYYKTSKAPPKGIITLQYTTIEAEDEKEAPKGEKFCFRLRTPLSQFVLKAKHQVAMEEWLDAIDTVKTGKKKEKGEKEKRDEEGGLLGDSEFTELNRMADVSLETNAGYFKKFLPTIAYLTVDGKKKVVKLQAGTTTIGRSESCTITIEDKQISRSHAKIDVTEASAIISDLGSGHGTRVNHQPITARTLLKHGDSIGMGKTKLKFLVTRK